MLHIELAVQLQWAQQTIIECRNRIMQLEQQAASLLDKSYSYKSPSPSESELSSNLSAPVLDRARAPQVSILQNPLRGQAIV